MRGHALLLAMARARPLPAARRQALPLPGAGARQVAHVPHMCVRVRVVRGAAACVYVGHVACVARTPCAKVYVRVKRTYMGVSVRVRVRVRAELLGAATVLPVLWLWSLE